MIWFLVPWNIDAPRFNIILIVFQLHVEKHLNDELQAWNCVYVMELSKNLLQSVNIPTQTFLMLALDQTF